MSDSHEATVIARVAGLWRYPVKSMGAEALPSVDVSWQGFAGDRRWAFVRDGAVRSGFPWLTLRERPDLNRYRPAFTEPDSPDTSPTVVRTPSGEVLDVADPELAAELSPEGARVIRQSRGIFDTFPLSLVTTQTIARIGELAGDPLDALRFRPNIALEAVGDAPFLEDGWVGSVLRIGGARIRVDKRDSRCVVITIDPETGEKNPAILRAVAQERDGHLGVYASTVEPGRIAVGDAVWIEASSANPASR